jgi:hypothetical protein
MQTEMNDPRELIARSPMSALQVLVIGVTVALNALDGFDVASISFAGPGIRKEWGLDAGALASCSRWKSSAWHRVASAWAEWPTRSAGVARFSHVRH